MTTGNKKKKLIHSQPRNNNKSKNIDVGEDLISELPDSVIQYILSFLPTKLAVSTTVLSKRWINLWISMPVLDFREWRTIGQEGDMGILQIYLKQLYEKTNRFMDFVDKTLLSNSVSTIQKFCLDIYSIHFDENRVKKWITALITRKVEELILERCPTHRLVPPDLFSCASLTVLDVNFDSGQHVLDFPQSISLPRLKVLRLSGVEFTESTKQVFSSFPILEELVLCKCSAKELDVISFSAPHLKHFTLENSSLKGFAYNLKVEIDAPNLVSIKFSGCLPRDLPAGNFPSVVEADFLYSSGDNQTTTLDSLSKFVRMYSNIKLLKATYEFLQIFVIKGVPSPSFPTFDNLTHLEVEGVDPKFPRKSSLFNFLHLSPNLESLVINVVTQNINGNVFKLNKVPQCLLLSLKSIELRNFNGYPDEMVLVKLILKHARVLERVIIRSASSSDVELDFSNEGIIEKVLRIPRVSKTCSFQAFETNMYTSRDRSLQQQDEFSDE